MKNKYCLRSIEDCFIPELASIKPLSGILDMVSDTLIYLSDGGYNNIAGGICYSFADIDSGVNVEKLMRFIGLEDYKYFSGNYDYPVEGLLDCPAESFIAASHYWTGEYGERRLELCRYLIESIGLIVDDLKKEGL